MLPCSVALSGESPVPLGKNVLCAEKEGGTFQIFCGERFFMPAGILSDRSFDRFVRRFDISGGQLIIPTFAPMPKAKCEDLFVANETVFGQEYVINAHIDGFMKLTVTGFNESSTVQVPIEPQKMETRKIGDLLFVFMRAESTFVAVYTTSPLKCVFTTVCADIRLEDNAVITYVDRGALSLIRRDLRSFDKNFTLLGSEVVYNIKEISFLPPPLFTLAFFEVTKNGGDARPFLHSDLCPKSKELYEFIGSPRIVIPPFIKGNDAFLLIGDELRSARLEMTDGKISDVDIF